MTNDTASAILPGHLYTYQDLAALFGICAKTVSRWFAKRRKFKPSKNTVRIPGSEVQKFIQEQMSPEVEAKKEGVRRTKRPVEGR